MRTVISLLACLMTGCTSLAPPPPSAASPAALLTTRLAGAWRSVAPELYGSHHATRAFVFTDRDWQVTYHAFADAQGQQPLFTIRVAGPYVLGEPSATVAGAVEGIFPARSRTLTADSVAGVQMFAGMGCQLTQGAPLALVNTGCGFVPGVMQVMGEYDLVALKDGQLFLGDRAGDLSKARPARRTPHPLIPAR